MWNETAAIIRRELGPQESLLWSGQPRKGLAFRSSDLVMIPFSLMWGGFAIVWETMVIRANAPLFMIMWGIPFVLIGLYLIVGRFFVDAKQRSQIHYAVTNERVIIITNFFGRKLKSLSLHTLSEMTLDQKPDGSGTITFGPANTLTQWNMSGLSRRKGQPSTPCFEMIQDAKRVYEIIREAQRRV